MGDETIVKSGHYPLIDENLCTGCGLCVKKCPYKAIKIINLPQEPGKCTFQYSANSFRLYGFILPKEKSVVGLIGVNGIGKSTALDLARGKIKPNFGNFNKKLTGQEVKKQVRGQEIQRYMEKLGDNQVKFSHKMQHVDELAKSKEAAENLLEECDEEGRGKKLWKTLELEDIKERGLNQLSGGELQRVALACALTKKADVYCIDEPSSYLDVSQRLNAAKVIRSVAQTSSIILVEHDLALLDYLSDFVHVLYGEKGAYGVISHLKSSKNGVNEYLQGFLRDENIRFRNNAIKFQVRSAAESKATTVFAKYSALEKNFGKFSLKVDEGNIRNNEVLGILGPNGIGKSTFVKMLAGEEKPDSGYGFKEKLTVSYKPQYIESNFDGTAVELLQGLKNLNRSTLLEIRQKLDVAELEHKKVKTLSGGELQRLSIAIALSTQADLYLLDEPSAFLDVEQRLQAAELIRKVVKDSEKNAFVIDHDVVFADNSSERLIVFDGKPGKTGHANSPKEKKEGMNAFLSSFKITFRRDEATGRPRANKADSQKDVEQKQKEEYYYTE